MEIFSASASRNRTQARGVVTRRRNATLVAINIELLGQSVAAEVDVGELEMES